MLNFIGAVPNEIREAGLDGLMEAIRASRGVSHIDLAKRIAATDSAIPAALLTERLAVVLQKPYPPRDALLAWGELPGDARTPLGAESIEYAQVDRSGEIGVLGMSAGQDNIPTNGNFDVVTDVRKPIYFGSVVRLSLREKQAQGFLGDGRIDSVTARIERAREVHLDRDFGQGGYAWAGYPTALGPFGFLNHPGISRVLRSVPYSQAGGSTGQQIVNDVGDAIEALRLATNSVAATRKVVIATRLSAALKSTAYSAQLGYTLWKNLQDNFPEIEWVEVDSLNGVGPSGEHGMVCLDSRYRYAAGLDIIAPPSVLPVQFKAFDDLYYMFHASGGFKSIERFGLILNLVPAS